jgi:hypothetical protein
MKAPRSPVAHRPSSRAIRCQAFHGRCRPAFFDANPARRQIARELDAALKDQLSAEGGPVMQLHRVNGMRYFDRVIETSGLYTTAGFGSHTFYQAYFSLLQHAWDQHFQHSQLVIVICGSHVRTMELLFGRQSPLFGQQTSPLDSQIV